MGESKHLERSPLQQEWPHFEMKVTKYHKIKFTFFVNKFKNVLMSFLDEFNFWFVWTK